MWKYLKSLFVQTDHTRPTKSLRSGAGSASTTSVTVESDANTLSSEEIKSAYFGLILGVHSPAEAELNCIENEAIMRLKKLIDAKESRAELVPRIPAIIPRLMQSLRDENVSGAELARQIGKDASLVSEVIRIANSPYYRTVNKIQSLEQAVVILGRNGIRQFLASSAFKPIFSTRGGYFTNLASGWIWRQSDYCAFSAQCLAKGQPVEPFEAYLAGLVHDIGSIVALMTMDKIKNVSDAPRSYKFQRIFAQQSLKLSSIIASEWDFPETVIQAIQDQSSTSDPAAMSSLGSVLHPATLMSQLQILIEEHRVKDDNTRMTCRIEGYLTDKCKKCFGNLQRYAS